MGAAEMMAAMGRLMASQLRIVARQPFGLVNNESRLLAFVGSHSQGAQIEQPVNAGQAITLAPVSSVTLCYGIREDPLSPYVEVLTDFTPDHSSSVGLRFALAHVADQPDTPLAGDMRHRGPARPQPSRGPLERGRVQIVVAGSPRTVNTQIYRGFHGLQFIESGLQVTVIARGHWPQQPEFTLVTDLEPYLAAMASPILRSSRRSCAHVADGLLRLPVLP